jgi:RNA polymerase sigma-70 factor, ECF subfamily
VAAADHRHRTGWSTARIGPVRGGRRRGFPLLWRYDSTAALGGGVAVVKEARPEQAGTEMAALEALDRGDREGALTLLMEAFGVALYRYCRQMVVDPDLADDVHQLTFVQAFEGLGRFARGSSLRTWLFGIARHRCLDALKTGRRRRARFESTGELPERPAAGRAPEESLAARDLTRALERCLEELAPAVRTAVLLRYQEGLAYPEMASVCRDRPATLQARVARALPVLRRCIEQRGHAL